MKFWLYILLFVLLESVNLFAGFKPENLGENTDSLYIIRLKTGDLLTGVVEKNSANEKGRKYIELRSTIGVSMIYHDEISRYRPYVEIYKHSHRIFLMPTAEPIGQDFFVGNVEVAGLYGGFGITKYLSITGIRSVIPTLYKGQQVSNVNFKSTVYQRPLNSKYEGHLSVAVGINYAWINDRNSFNHLFASMTFRLKKSGFTTNIFYKNGGKDVYDLHFKDAVYTSYYPGGTLGLGFGVDTKFSDRHNLFFIGEVWNKNIQALRETAFTTGFRIALDKISVDWGLMIFTNPYAVPYFSFIWTPF